MKKKPPVFQDQKTIKENEKEIQCDLIMSLKIAAEEIKQLLRSLSK